MLSDKPFQAKWKSFEEDLSGDIVCSKKATSRKQIQLKILEVVGKMPFLRET